MRLACKMTQPDNVENCDGWNFTIYRLETLDYVRTSQNKHKPSEGPQTSNVLLRTHQMTNLR